MTRKHDLQVHIVIFDLEDAVTPAEKVNARETLKTQLAAGGYGARVRLVRINGFDTEWGRPDAEAVAGMDCDAVLLPKVVREFGKAGKSRGFLLCSHPPARK